MGADPIQAARNVTETEKRASEIRVLVARGLIADLVSELARLMAGRTVTGPEEVRLQDLILREAQNYVRGLNGSVATLDYLSPKEQARRVDEQSTSISELKRMAQREPNEVERAVEEVEREVQKALGEDPPTKGVIAFGLPKSSNPNSL